MFLFELIAVWLLMKGRHPGARVLIATTWSGCEEVRGLRGRWGESHCLSLQTRRAIGKWLGWGVQRELRGGEAQGAQAAGLEGGYRCPEWQGCYTAPVPAACSRSTVVPGIPHSLSYAERASENSKGRKAFGNIPAVFKGKIQSGALSRVLAFLTGSKGGEVLSQASLFP